MSEKEVVNSLGKIIGFGNMMKMTHECWSDIFKNKGEPDSGVFMIGPCKGFTVPCVCNNNDRYECEFCMGSGWLTKKIKDIITSNLKPKENI